MQTKSKRLGLILNSTQIYNFLKKKLVHFLLVHAGNVWMTTAITHQSIFSTQTSFRVVSGLPTSTTTTLCKALAITY